MNKIRKMRITLAGVVLLLAQSSFADRPNDDCATATVVTDGAPAAVGANSFADENDDGEATCQEFSDSDVWFEYLAICNGVVRIDTIGSGQDDTVLSAYDACGGTEIACDDDGGPGTLAAMSFPTTSGATYWIRLASFGAPGDYQLNIECIGAAPNDDCPDATVVTDGTPAAEGNNAVASETDDAEAVCQEFSDSDVWFEYVATCTGGATVDTDGSGQTDTVLSVFDVCGGAELACNDDDEGTLARIRFDVIQGQSYLIRLGSFDVPGDYDLNIVCASIPDNDDCASATVVTDGTPAAEGNNSQADEANDGEAECQEFSDNDVWFEYTATCTGGAFVDTIGSGQSDTVLAVFDACGGAELACNDDSEGTLSAVTFSTVEGTTYWIRLGSFGAPGEYDLNITCVAVPENDFCASKRIVADGTPAAEGNNALAGETDDAEATCQEFSDGDVWFQYDASCQGGVTVDTFGSGQSDTVITVYDGCGGEEIACNDDADGLLSSVTFESVLGNAYSIRLASFGVPGDYDLNIVCVGVPGNDACATATSVTDGAPAFEGDNSQADESDDAEASCQEFSDGDVWFEYTATCTGGAIVDTTGSEQEDTVLTVHDACGGEEITCNDDDEGTLARVSFDTSIGESYFIRLASFGIPGDYDLNITCVAMPDNDDCASALPITDGTPAAEGNNARANETDDAEATCQEFSDGDVWFEYTATCTGGAIIDTLGSEQSDTVLSVYDTCGGEEVVCNDDDALARLSSVSIDTALGQSFLIRLASFGLPGDYDVNIVCISVPDNDTCSAATVVTDGVPAAEGNNAQAEEPDDGEAACQEFSDADVWFEYTATCSGDLVIDTFGSGQSDTVLSVHDGCGGEEIACNDDTDGFLSQIVLDSVGGQTYWVRLASFDLPGDYDLNIQCFGAATGACCRGEECSITVPGECKTCDLCDTCNGDIDCDGQVNPVDSGLCQSVFGSTDPADLCRCDVDCDGQINPVDSGLIQSRFGTCDPQRLLCPGFGRFQGLGTDCEDDPCVDESGACCIPGGENCDWDNGLVPNGFSARALSPPNFPDIRVADDIIFTNSCTITTVSANIIEDAGWTDGGEITFEVRLDAAGQPGDVTAAHVGGFTKIDTGDQYFGRDDFNYIVDRISISLAPGRYWVGLRNAGGGGSGTNYWLTSDGGADGPASSTGWFSLDAGTTWSAEGAGWHHAFDITTTVPDQCTETDETTCGKLNGTFQGVGTNCQDDPCVDETGACCIPGGKNCDWDNGLVPNGFSARALSPPNFPDIRVADDIIFTNSCTITTVSANIIEDAGWTDGAEITFEVRLDAAGQPGDVTAAHVGGFTKIDTGDQYFGRDDFNYIVDGISISLAPGRYWVGLRNAGGGGSGTNYWLTSDGGADGPASSTGWFSLDAGTTWSAEGAGWHHAFDITTTVPDQCTDTDETTCGKLNGTFQGVGTNCEDDPCG